MVLYHKGTWVLAHYRMHIRQRDLQNYGQTREQQQDEKPNGVSSTDYNCLKYHLHHTFRYLPTQ